MAIRDEELQGMRGASPSAFTPFSQARGAEAIRGFGSGMSPRLSEPQSVFAGSPMPRTPEQQQALLDNIRKNAPALNQQRTDWVQNTIQQRRENPTTYTTPSGKSVAVPTNRFGEPIKAWMDQLGDSGRLNYGPRPAPQTASATPSQPSQGIRFAPTPSRPIPMPVVDSMGTRIGVTSDFGGFGSPISMGLGGMGFGGMEAFPRGQQTPTTQTPYGVLNLPNTQDLLSRRRRPQTTMFT